MSALNIFFEKAVERVEDNGGMVNKFLGDGFMAIFAIDDTVNVAARIESLTKNVSRDLLISAATSDRLTATYSLEEMPPQPIKGKQHPVSIRAVRDLVANAPAADRHNA